MLFRTTQTSKHRHIIYLHRDETGSISGFTTENNKHSHPIVVDENGLINLLPAGKNAHIHELDKPLDYTPEDNELETDEEKIAQIKEYIKIATQLDEKSIEDGQIAEKYYAGEQWDDADVAILKKNERPAITLNEIAPKIDLLCGNFRQNKTDITFYPKEGGDANVARISTEMFKHIATFNDFEVTETEIFKDQVVPGRGIICLYTDYDRNMFGEVVIERLPWKDVSFGPHLRWDLRDCEYAVIKKKVPLKKLLQLYPEFKDELKSPKPETEPVISTQTYLGEDYDIPETSSLERKLGETVYDVWERAYETIYSIADIENGFVTSVNNISKKDIAELEGLGLSVIKRVIRKMNVYLMCNSLLLEERQEDQDFFPVTPVYGKRDSDMNFYGKVKEVLDVQNLINKLVSQSTDILSRQTSYGFYYDDNTFNTKKEEDQWANNVAKPGFRAKVKDIGKIPVQTQGTKFPSELVQLQNDASMKMLTIMNLAEESLGFSSREVSSTAIVEKNRNAMKAQQFLMDNFDHAKKLLARNVIKMVQKVYTPERVLRLLGNTNPKSEEDQMKNAQLQETIKMFFEDEDLVTLDIVSSLSVYSATARSASFSTLMEMSRNGMPITPDIIIEASDMPNKESILTNLRGQQASQAKSEQDKNDTELKKTLYAKLDPAQAQQIMAQNMQQNQQQPQ